MMGAPQKKWRILLVVFVIVSALLGSAGLQIWLDYRETIEAQRTMVRDITRVVEAEVRSTVQVTEATLDLVADVVREDKGLGRIREPSRWRKIHTACQALNGCVFIAAVDLSGQVLANSTSPTAVTYDVSDRQFFLVTKATRKLFVAPAVVSRIPGHPILFSIAIPVLDASGNLLAILSAGMSTAHLTQFYGLLGFNVEPTVTIFKGNGDLVARSPEMEKFVGKNFVNGPLFTQMLPLAPSGIYNSKSVLDGKERLAAYSLIKELDIVVFSGIEGYVTTKRWRERSERTAATTGFALVTILLMLYAGYRLLQKDAQLKSRNSELDRLSKLDPLTGIANRRAFDAGLERQLKRRRDGDAGLSLLMVDVDYFKGFNDRYGHQAGDECLRKVARALQDSLLRAEDMVARYGGEEFSVILNAAESGAARVAERMRHAVESMKIPHEASTTNKSVTISVGYATATNAATAGELIADADAGLYRAKHLGRNQVAKSE